MCLFLKKQPTSQQFLFSFLLINETSKRTSLSTRTAINAKIPVYVIFVEAIISFKHNIKSQNKVNELTSILKFWDTKNVLHRVSLSFSTLSNRFLMLLILSKTHQFSFFKKLFFGRKQCLTTKQWQTYLVSDSWLILS